MNGTRTTPTTPNVLLVVTQHIAANIVEVKEDIAATQRKLGELTERLQELTAIARAANVPLTDETDKATSAPALVAA